MTESDKYPGISGRRRFVKGVVGSAALAGVGTSANAMVNTSTAPAGEGGGVTEFFGIERTGGPAPRGMPMIPVELDDEGYLQGVFPEYETVTQQGQEVEVAQVEIAGIEYGPEWFQYCGVQTYPGLQPNSNEDNYFRYSASAPYDWQVEDVSGGDRMHVDDFDDYEDWGNDIGDAGVGKPAIGEWRSQDADSGGTIPVQVLRVPPDVFEEIATDNEEWLEAASEENFVAWLNKCTHYCCVPSFKGSTQSLAYDAANDVYCPCHQSVYDPFSIVLQSFISLPRPEDNE